MGSELYVANFETSIPDEQLRELFARYGEVLALNVGLDEKNGQPFALVQMASEKIATKAYNGLNGALLGNRHLAVSYPEVDTSRELTAKNRKVVEEIVAALDESDEIPLRQIESIVRLCGATFAQAVLAEALEVEAGPGVRTTDGAHRRTKGGVFFYLVRYRISPAVRRIVYNRKGKMPE